MLKAKFDNAQSVAIVDYSGTTVNDQVTLRSAITAAGGEMLVAKNTLIDIAADGDKAITKLNACIGVYNEVRNLINGQ